MLNDLHLIFYNVGAVAGIMAGCLCAVLLVWTLRDARRSALRACTIGLLVCLAVFVICMLGMKLTA